MRADDIEKLISIGRPTIAPDGAFAVFASSRPDLGADRAVGQLWRIALPDGPARRLTRGIADSGPRLRPDGAVVGFLRADARDHTQIFVVGAGGGEPVQATDAPLGVTAFDWSPDGGTLAYLARIPEPGRYGTTEGLDAAAEPPRRITGVRWHANGLGYLVDRPAQLFVIRAPHADAEPFYPRAAGSRRAAGADGSDADDVSDSSDDVPVIAATPVPLTDGALSHTVLAFSADGSEVFTAIDELESDRRDLRSRVLAHRVDGSGVREVVGRSANLAVDDIAVAGDGALALLAADVGPGGVDFVAPGVALWVADDRAEPRRLTDPERVDLGETGSHITPVGADFLVQDRTRGRVRLVRVTREGDLTEVLGGDVHVLGHAAAGPRIVAAVANATSYGEIVCIDGDRARMPTGFGAGVAAAGIVSPEEITITSRDGYPVHGWVAVPAGGAPHPVILQIHGGPYAAYGIQLFDETQVLVDAGYAVVYCNPRGSAGYGRAHGRSIRQSMGSVDLTDVLDFLDGVLAQDERLDGDRVGIMGGSYGGYLTAWTIAHDHRFAGAIVERGFLDPVSFQGTSDIGSFFGQEYVGTDAAAIAAQSPLAVVAQVETPTLVIHSELDFRCPLEQATRYYSALKRQGTPAELLIFPGEDHELSRSGRPRHRVERFEAVLDWWSRCLPVD